MLKYDIMRSTRWQIYILKWNVLNISFERLRVHALFVIVYVMNISRLLEASAFLRGETRDMSDISCKFELFTWINDDKVARAYGIT